MSSTRRDFLKAFGLTAAALAAGPAVAAPLMSALENPAPAAVAKPDCLMSLLIRALPSNTGPVFFAPTTEMSKDRSKAMALEPGAFVEFSHFGQAPTLFWDKNHPDDRIELSIVTARSDDHGSDIAVHIE